MDTIQDKGRYGYGNWGINPGGTMDPFASQVANVLVGNSCGEAVLELHFPGPQIIFEHTSLICITGADFTPMLDDEPLPLWQPVVVRRNAALYFEQVQWGACCYVAIHGGFAINKWLNSYSTNLKAEAGGWKGRRLEKGDRLCLNENQIYFAGWLKADHVYTALPWRPDVKNVYEHPREIYVLPGNEWQQLAAPSQKDFLKNEFTIQPSSDRMGYHLKGSPLKLELPVELISSAVSFGTIQLLPNGQMVVLMADHQTTGGYPRIGHVISAHLPKMAQLRPGDSIQFAMTNIATAEELLLSQQQELKIIGRSCEDHLKQLVC